jgi:membrane-bound lytic murein transglycosylase D
MDEDMFRKYNPALRRSVYNNSKYIPKGYQVRVPIIVSPDSVLAAIPNSAYFANQKKSKYYRIRYGDNLSKIARRYGTTVETLMAINNISNAHYIRRGMTIRLPDETDMPILLAMNKNDKIKSEKPIRNEGTKSKPSAQIAAEVKKQKSKGTTAQVIPSDHRIPFAIEKPDISTGGNASRVNSAVQTNGKTMADLEIDFIQKKDPAIGYIRVEPEETLGHYSDWLQIKTQKIRNWNNLSYSSPINLNQKIKLVFNKITPGEFNRMRLEYHRGLEEDFFENYEITDTLTHRVKRGENLWYICNYVYNLPYWLIVDFNKDLDLEKLKVGDKLTIPGIKSRG